MRTEKDTFLCFVFYIKPFIIPWISDWGLQSFIKWLTNIWMILNRNINIKTNLLPFSYDFHLQSLPFFKLSPWIHCLIYNQFWTCSSLPNGKMKVNFCAYVAHLSLVIYSKPVWHLLRSTQKSVLFISMQTSTLFPVNRKTPNKHLHQYKIFPSKL